MATVLAAQRRQAVTDILRRQRTEALVDELANPAAVLARWIEQDHADWSKPPATEDVQVFAQYRPQRERAVEYEALEILRDFIDGFPELHQKQMLFTLLASGMQRAGRPEHAAKVATLLNGHLPAGTDNAHE
ncbi:hypothetical protein [Streptomyces sp. NPDC051994]|uniref:hypothetical protein n=1 Tax=unclassified Streptomyces TaxID=2593676 RepID=UPI00341C757D